MRTRKLGPLDVSVVGLGCNNFGRTVDEAGTQAVVDAALEAGVTFFDTADVYGNKGGSETLLGKALVGRRDQVVLATKFGSDMGAGTARNGSRDYIRSAIEASLRRPRWSASTSTSTTRRIRARRSKRPSAR
jgi:aryl-alcohol dehydrogenase-like predicted oxidoreductase